jgi:hypothetical protein
MQNRNRPHFILAVLRLIPLLAACGSPSTGSPQPATSTADPCAAEVILASAIPVHALMREFDDSAQVAVLADVSQMVFVIPPLQEVRRRAEDLQVPACLATLKGLEIDYMNSVINTLLVFMQVGAGNTEVLVQGITQGRSLHDQYNQELTRLVGAGALPDTSLEATPAP